MSAFSYHYHPFLVDSSSSFFPTTNSNNNNNNNNIPSSSSSSFEEQAHINTSSVVTNQDTTSYCVDQSSSKVTTTTISYTTEYPSPNNFVAQNQSPDNSMVVDKLETGKQEKVVVIATPMEKKRKTSNGSSLNNNSNNSPLSSKDYSTEGRSKKQKKSSNNNNNGGVKGEDKLGKEEKKDKKKSDPEEEPPTGYIHVRARRGQATDSHSLAERVRREKISERMKVLQRLVPGCDKVTGKALVLDEIINYVQSLQNQVEFLSMKLASLNPLFLDLAMDMDNLFVRPQPDHQNIQKSNSIAQECSPNMGTTTFADTTTITTTNFPINNYVLDYSSSPIFLQGERLNLLSEYGQFWDVEDQRQKLLHPYGFGNNLCSLN